jgi:hypothetical protein
MTLNVCWQTFPVNGWYLNFGITGVITACAACLIVLFPNKSGWRTQPPVGLAEGNEDKNFNRS